MGIFQLFKGCFLIFNKTLATNHNWNNVSCTSFSHGMFLRQTRWRGEWNGLWEESLIFNNVKDEKEKNGQSIGGWKYQTLIDLQTVLKAKQFPAKRRNNFILKQDARVVFSMVPSKFHIHLIHPLISYYNQKKKLLPHCYSNGKRDTYFRLINTYVIPITIMIYRLISTI